MGQPRLPKSYQRPKLAELQKDKTQQNQVPHHGYQVNSTGRPAAPGTNRQMGALIEFHRVSNPGLQEFLPKNCCLYHRSTVQLVCSALSLPPLHINVFEYRPVGRSGPAGFCVAHRKREKKEITILVHQECGTS